MPFVYYFFGMTIFCTIMGIIFAAGGFIFLDMSKEHIADKFLSLSYSFVNCAFFFLCLEIAARFFA